MKPRPTAHSLKNGWAVSLLLAAPLFLAGCAIFPAIPDATATPTAAPATPTRMGDFGPKSYPGPNGGDTPTSPSATATATAASAPTATDQPTPTFTPWPSPTPTPTATPMPLFAESPGAGKVLLLRHNPENGYKTVREAGGGNLHVLDANGETPLATGGGYLNARWITESEVLALRREGGGLTLVVLDAASGQTVRRVGTLEKPLEQYYSFPGSRMFGWLQVAPGGSGVLVQFDDGFYVVDLATGKVQVRIEHEGKFLCCPTWSPDSKRVAYYIQEEQLDGESRTPRRYSLRLVDLESDESLQVASELLGWYNTYPRNHDPIPWAADGRSVFVRPREGAEVVSRDLERAYFEVGAPLASLDSSGGSWSEVLTAETVRQAFQVHGMSLDGKLLLSQPTRRPGGGSLAFSATDLGKTYALGTLSLDGETVQLWPQRIDQEFVDHTFPNAPVWAPDGKKVALYTVSYDYAPDEFLDVVSLETGAMTRVWTRDDSASRLIKPNYFDWSPDGRWVWLNFPWMSKEGWTLLVNADDRDVSYQIAGQVLDWR